MVSGIGTPDVDSVRIWLHAASVGEVQPARALIMELEKMFPDAAFILSVMTAQGMAVARRQLGNRVRCIYAPLDLPGIVGRVAARIRPDVYICLETELWPNILRRLRRNGTRLLLLNGRLSQRSFRRYQRVGRFMKQVLANFSAIAVISDQDGQRFIDLGAEPGRVTVAGNAKYDLATTTFSPATAAVYRSRLGIGEGTPLLVAGSTHTGEEEMLLPVYRDLKKDARLRDLVLVLAPRHLRRLPEIEMLLRERGIAFEKLSWIEEHGRSRDVVLVDGVGDLAGLYSVATYVFCGGSLVERGGHNIMEAAVYGKPVFYGPHMNDFADAVQLLESVRAGLPIREAREMTAAIIRFLDHQEEYRAAGVRAGEIAMAQQGSARRQAMLVKELLDSSEDRRQMTVGKARQN
ncbi:MAG: 3-deoxy-D-manno-octulosonic acid transferase [Desulfobacterales bacterium]|nr:3-deoxy-D-manno-octulosonic acid transferase [Desulfobacterales bacterium]